MSGGVDSSLSAALLVEQGYAVTGVYMKNWTRDIAGWPCPWRQDFLDAERVAVQLGIELRVFDFQEQYKHKVVDYMIDAYRAGQTPNPDIMCNQEIKFKLFLDTALEQGADRIAAGHYARINHAANVQGRALPENALREKRSTKQHTPLGSDPVAKSQSGSRSQLYRAADRVKDQTYFLYRMSQAALDRTLFPIGDFMDKDSVRTEAKKRGLATAAKPDSQGICFVGEVGVRDFLREFVEVTPGPILDQTGREIGQHEGALLYTIGQRHGLDVGGGLPYYVTSVDVDTNTVYVTSELSSDLLWTRSAVCQQAHWIDQLPVPAQTYQVRTRHRGELVPATLDVDGSDTFVAQLSKDMRALTPGQSLVIYDGEQVLGGGIILHR